MISDKRTDKRGGLGWLVRRLWREFTYAPTQSWSIVPLNAALDMRARIAPRRPKTRATNPTAVYDLRICSNTFDFAYFLYDAETHFRALGFDRFDVCILDDELFDRGEYENVISWDKRRKRVNALLVPLAKMYQACRSVRVLNEPDELIALCENHEPIFPRHADGKQLRSFRYADVYRKMAQQVPYSGLTAPRDAIEKVLQFNKLHGVNMPFVTLTTRAYSFQPLRNTDMDVYFGFADYLQSVGFVPIFIPDADAPKAVDFRNYLVFEDACSDLYLRTAIYELAFTNVFTSNGTHAVAAFDKKASLIISVVNENYGSNSGTKRWKSEGLTPGQQPFGGTTKHFIWAKESLEGLKERFEIVRRHRRSDSADPIIEPGPASCAS